MLFNSLEFPLFLITVLIFYYTVGFRAQNKMLLVASYVFYGWWDPKFLYLIILSTSIDYVVGIAMEKGRLTVKERLLPSAYLGVSAVLFLGLNWGAISFKGINWSELLSPDETSFLLVAVTVVALIVINALYPTLSKLKVKRRKLALLFVSLATNLGILGFFKYYDFFVTSVQDSIAMLGWNIHTDTLSIILPVGISFYTFQTLSYSIDIYRGKIKPTHNFFDFALFVAYFPQLVAGPIERASHLLPELSKARVVKSEQITRGVFLILLGLFKKVCVADGVAGSVNSVYGTTGAVSWIDVVAATVLFAVQIYCDFSGYSDIARGTSKLLGIDLMTNFNLPYFSRNPSEFWQRWHISLSSWLRDYLYIPLGGNRGKKGSTSKNLMITMVLGGLWHGAAWNYILWGFYQGLILTIYRVFDFKAASRDSLSNGFMKAFMWAVFFMITCYGWLLFRANDFNQVVEFTQVLFTGSGGFMAEIKRPTLAAVAGILLLSIHEVLQYRSNSALYYRALPSYVRGVFYAALLFLFIMGTSNEPSQFIYFQF